MIRLFHKYCSCHLQGEYVMVVQVTLRQSWCRAPFGAHDQILQSESRHSQSLLLLGSLPDERSGLSFVGSLCYICMIFTFFNRYTMYREVLDLHVCIHVYICMYTNPLCNCWPTNQPTNHPTKKLTKGGVLRKRETSFLVTYDHSC
jgi:hypothetical protein